MFFFFENFRLLINKLKFWKLITFDIYIKKKTLAAYAPHKLKHRSSFEETFLPAPIHIQSHKINLPINRKNRTIDNFVIYDTMGK